MSWLEAIATWRYVQLLLGWVSCVSLARYRSKIAASVTWNKGGHQHLIKYFPLSEFCFYTLYQSQVESASLTSSKSGKTAAIFYTWLAISSWQMHKLYKIHRAANSQSILFAFLTSIIFQKMDTSTLIRTSMPSFFPCNHFNILNIKCSSKLKVNCWMVERSERLSSWSEIDSLAIKMKAIS
jgi:hypothetical protein